MPILGERWSQEFGPFAKLWRLTKRKRYSTEFKAKLVLKADRMIEMPWRSPKWECIYLNVFETGSEARKGFGARIGHHNGKRPHSSSIV